MLYAKSYIVSYLYFNNDLPFVPGTRPEPKTAGTVENRNCFTLISTCKLVATFKVISY